MLNTKIVKYAILSLAVCLVMTSAFVAVNAKPAVAATFGDFEYSITADSTAVITGYTGPGGDIVIPEEITDGGNVYPVTAISKNTGPGVFNQNNNITSVTIPKSIINIGRYSFASCTALTNVYFEEGSALTSIQNYAFRGSTALSEITIPDSVQYLYEGVFANCTGLTEVTIPGGLQPNGSGQFSGCSNLTKVNLSSGLTTIRTKMFYQCTNLSEITIPDSVQKIYGNAFTYTNLSEVTIPESVAFVYLNAFVDIPSLHAVYFLGSANQDASNYIYETAFGNNAPDFVIYYHISQAASWVPWAGVNTKFPVKPFCTLTVDLNDGSAATGSYAVVTDGHIAAPADPVREGYAFGGWYSDAACTTAFDFAGQTVTDDVTVYAKWTQGILGDINGDECVDLLDISLATDYMMETSIPTAEEFTKADVNQDGCIDLLDVSLITDIAMEF